MPLSFDQKTFCQCQIDKKIFPTLTGNQKDVALISLCHRLMHLLRTIKVVPS